MAHNKWRDICAEMKQDIMDGVLEAGEKLPTEPQLAAVYAAGRHSVRRAISELAKEGFLSVEQGRGTFVQPHTLLEYAIGKRTRLRRNLGSQGVDVSGQSMGAERTEATDRVAKKLDLKVGAPVIATHRITMADNIPVSFGTLYHDAARFPDFPERRQAFGSVSAVYKSYGVEDYLRKSTQMHARPASRDEAQKLRQHADMPVIIVRAVDALTDGTPIAFSEVIWSAARIKFTISDTED